MSSAYHQTASTDPRIASSSDRALSAQIDESTRAPVLWFLSAAVCWLMLGSLLGLINSIKVHLPEFLSSSPWLTYGRVQAAYDSVVVYGWGSSAAVALILWLMARLSRAPLRHAGVLYVAAVFWNLGVVIGTAGILTGDMLPLHWLEFPAYVTPLLFVSYVLVAVWGVLTFRSRRDEHTYASQWYLFAALFCFPWLYSAAQLVLVCAPVQGVLQAVTNVWYAHSLLWLWFTPVALAAAYYFIPKLLGRPIHDYPHALLGFWSLVALASWTGGARLIGAPVPLWVQAVGTVSSMMMLLPLFLIGLNLHGTLLGTMNRAWSSPTLRFVIFGACNFTLAGLISILMSVRPISQVVQFTSFAAANLDHFLYAFFSMTVFGAFYYIVPRLVRKEWPSAGLINVHFWTTAGGITLYLVGMYVSGWSQWQQMNNPAEHPDFLRIVEAAAPWFFVRVLAGILLLIGHVAFATSFVWMLFKRRTAEEAAPTLFNTPPALELQTP